MKWLLYLIAFSLGLMAFAEEPKIFTNVYEVPPTFLNLQEERRPSAREVLVNAGIDFPEGTSAAYNAATSQLIVKTTEDRMALVESYIESIIPEVKKQVHVTFRELDFEKRPQFFGELFDFETLPESGQPKNFRVFENRETFFEALSQPPRVDLPAADGLKRGIVGVFTDPQFQVVIRAASEELNLKEIPAASVMSRSGQPALVQVAAKRWGVVPVIGSDDFTIDLEYYLPSPGEAFFPDGPGSREPGRVTIWDGQTIAWAEEKKNGGWRIVFITAALVDPAGLPIRAEKRKAPEKRDP